MSDIEIRKLDCQALSDLSDILESNDDWKRLMAIIPLNLEPENSAGFKYNGEHFGLIECARKEQTRPCTAILIEEWGTSGKVRPRLSTLRQLLVKAQLFRGADYVSKLLNVPPPERPASGPAALVSIPSVDELPAIQVVPSPTPVSPIHMQPFFLPIETPVQQPTNDDGRSEVLTNGTNNENVQPDFNSAINSIFEDGIAEVPYNLLVSATDNFNEYHHLGSGACGTVYLGVFQPGNKQVAVKRLHKEGVPGDPNQQFRNEITAFSRLKHPNIIPLLGFCCEIDSLCLVYPYMKNGSLNDMLTTKEKKEQLNWKLRFDIAAGVANGVAHLHSLKIIHRDVKTANVLLDERMEPKVGDFGLVRPDKSSDSCSTIITNTVVGTKPYMSWEAFSGVITDKMDVFSYGVVLLELLTGLPALIENAGPLVDYVFEKKYEYETSSYTNFVEDIIDRTAGDWKIDIAKDLFTLALDCLANEKNSRPSMITVTQRLGSIKLNLV